MDGKSGNWDIISGIATFIFIGFLIATVFAYFYQTTIDFGIMGKVPSYPFRQYLFPLGFGAGLFLLIAVGSTLVSFQAERDSRIVYVKCSECRKETYDPDYDYCPYCGTSLPQKNTPGKEEKRCNNCGTKNDLDAIFCKKCSNKLD
jgi:hypothetical protein